MRKSKINVKRRISLLLFILVLLFTAYGIWFVSPYISFASRNKLFGVFLYPTSALVKTNNGIVTVTLYASDTAVFRFDLKKKAITIIRSKDKVGRISKSPGYFVIFPDTGRSGVEEAESVITQLTDFRFILGRRRYITYIEEIGRSVKMNLTIRQLFALWRTYVLNSSNITFLHQ